MTPLSIAFLPLTDSAVLVAAREMGFAHEAGIDLALVRTTSWATARDRLVFGQVQAAHMLAPLAIAVALGLSQHPAPIAAPFKLNVNGNQLVMATDFAAALEPDPMARIADPVGAAHDFAAAIGLHRRKPVIGIVHRFSSHALLLRYWLGYAGVDPDRDVTLRVLPPSLMVEALRAGEIDGFIAGEPWGSIAVAEGLGETAALGPRIWQRGVEKVLAFRADWLEEHPDIVDRLIGALSAAAAWCDRVENHPALAALLAHPAYLDRPGGDLLPALGGRMTLRRGDAAVDLPDRIVFHDHGANFPWRSQALWIYAQFARWGMVVPDAAFERRAGDVFRPDVYRRALAGRSGPLPGASMKLEGAVGHMLPVGAHRGTLTLGPDRFFDGAVFDPADVGGFIARYGVG